MNNAQLMTAIVAFVSLRPTVVAGAWLNQHALERPMEAFRNEVRAQFGKVRAEIHSAAQRLEARIGGVEARLAASETALITLSVNSTKFLSCSFRVRKITGER